MRSRSLRFAVLFACVLGWAETVHPQIHLQQAPPERPRSATGLFGFLHSALPVLPIPPVHYFAADLNADGHLDLLALTVTDTAYVLLGDGRSFHEGMQTIVFDPLAPWQLTPRNLVALGDVDGDGDLDAYLGSNSLQVNDGSGRFSDASANLPISTSGTHKFFEDVELDGDLDIVTWGTSTPHTQLRNDGSGRFTDWSASMPVFSPNQAVDAAMGDIDGDGDDDALVGSNYNQKGRLYRNQSGTFVDASAIYVQSVIGMPLRFSNLEVADFTLP